MRGHWPASHPPVGLAGEAAELMRIDSRGRWRMDVEIIIIMPGRRQDEDGALPPRGKT